MKTKTNIFLTLVTVFAIIATIFTGVEIGVSADENTPSLYIDMYNFSFRDSIAIKYAVRTDGNITGEVKMLVWTEAEVAKLSSENEYVLGTQSQILTTVGCQIIDNVTYDIFDLTGITAKQMTDVFYSRAIVEQDGTEYYSPIKKFSVAQYAHEIQSTGSEALLALVDSLLEYGAAAQKYLDYYTDWLATDKVYKISIVGGKLSDGTTEGCYKAGTTISAIPDPAEEGMTFSHWENSAGEKLSKLTVTKDDTFTAVYEKNASQDFSQGLKYTLNADGESYSVSGEGTCTDNNIIIPSTYEGKPVTSIGGSAFYSCSSLTSITIPDSVTSIGNDAFYGCSNLTSINIPDGVTSIGNWAFSGCSSLSSLTVQNGNPTYHSEGNCLIETATKTLISGCKNSVIPTDGSVTSIGDSAFGGCSSLTSITIPDSVTSIGDYAFSGCSSLTSINIPDSVTSIGYFAFQGCSSLTSITIPDCVTSIGDYAFSGCSSLTSINIPDSVTSIGEQAFYECSSLTSIKIPDSVTSIGEGAFADCSSLSSLTVQNGNSAYHSEGNCLIETATKTLISGCKNSVIPTDGSVTSIGDYAFSYCSSLTSINIPNGVTSIGERAFQGCSSLTSITIPDGVTSIGIRAFSGCSSLSSITVKNGNPTYHSEGNCLIETATKKLITGCATSVIPTDGSVTSIGTDAFYNCSSLTSITIPDSVTRIGNWAFSGCSSLTSITFNGTVSQWNQISKGSDWNSSTGNYTIHCTDGDISK